MSESYDILNASVKGESQPNTSEEPQHTARCIRSAVRGSDLFVGGDEVKEEGDREGRERQSNQVTTLCGNNSGELMSGTAA